MAPGSWSISGRDPASDAERSQTVAVAATFTAEPVEASLRFWMKQLGIPTQIEAGLAGRVTRGGLGLVELAVLLAANVLSAIGVVFERPLSSTGGVACLISATTTRLFLR